MSTPDRDELAARIAATLAPSKLSAEVVAARAYAIADALLVQRETPPSETLETALDEEIDRAEHPYDASWDLEPRWSEEDIAQRAAALELPGIVSVRPARHRARRAG